MEQQSRVEEVNVLFEVSLDDLKHAILRGETYDFYSIYEWS